MANTVKRNLHIIDTAGEVLASGTPIWISRMEWHPDSAGDDLLVMDAANVEEVWRVRSTADGTNSESYAIESKEFSRPRRYDGLDAVTLDSGTLYIWIA